MKKWLLAVLAVFSFCSLSFAEGWGIAIKSGIGQNNPKTAETLWDYYGGTLTTAPGIFALEGFYEFEVPPEEGDLLEDVNTFGIGLGYNAYGENELEDSFLNGKEETYAIPITFYLKVDKGIKGLSSYFGAGITSITTKVSLGTDTYKKSVFFPHLSCGFEYKFSKVFAIGLEVKYNIHAEVVKDNITMSDRSGIQGLGVAKFYF